MKNLFVVVGVVLGLMVGYVLGERKSLQYIDQMYIEGKIDAQSRLIDKILFELSKTDENELTNKAIITDLCDLNENNLKYILENKLLIIEEEKVQAYILNNQQKCLIDLDYRF